MCGDYEKPFSHKRYGSYPLTLVCSRQWLMYSWTAAESKVLHPVAWQVKWTSGTGIVACAHAVTEMTFIVVLVS